MRLNTSQQRSLIVSLRRYGVAVMLAMIAFLLSRALWPVVDDSPYLFFMAAVALSAWYGGLGPGLVATLLSIMLTDTFLIEPIHTSFGDPSDYVQLSVFSLVAFLISWTENHRRQSELALRQALDSLPIPIRIMTPDGVITEVNRAALNLDGEDDPGAIRGQPFDSMPCWSYSPEAPDQLRMLVAMASVGVQVRHDVRVQTPDDDYRTVDLMISPMRDERGEITHLISSAVDITERKERENKIVTLTHRLQAQTHRLDGILANIPGIVFEAIGPPTPEGQPIHLISDYCQKMLGYPPEEWQRDPQFFMKCLHPDDLEDAVRDANAVYEQEKSGVVQFRMIARDGSIVHAEAHSSVLTNDNGQPTGACGVIMDVTQRKMIEAQLAQYMGELHRSNEELEQFAYVASHDLQEPLRKIRSYLQLIERRYADKLDDSGREFIDFAIDGATRMRELIQDLLTYSRLQRNEDPFQPLDLGELLEGVINMLQLQVQESGARITCDDLPCVTASSRQMTQLFQNLLSNALKFRGERPPAIHIGVQSQADWWVLSVRDNGIGIDPDQGERIFEVFQRLHQREAYAGTGIGLAVCKRVVENHGGRIWVESQPGEGATFYFTLPS